MKLSRIESSVRVVLAFNEAFNRHDAAAMMALMSDDCLFENTYPPPDGETYKGREAVGQFWQEFFRQSPRAHILIEEVFGLGMRCVMRWRYEWLEADGSAGHVRGVDIFQVRDGLICEKLSYVKG